MSDKQVTRVHYFERQFLRPSDFADEQDYHVAMRRRHNISHHTWGVVSGLEVIAEEGNLYVQPGVAVDGYGRELILPQRQPLSSNAFSDKGSNELDVWLVYERSGSDDPPSGYAGCGDTERGGASFYRWQETARVQLERPDPDFPDRRQPESVPVADRSFSPVRTPPDDPVNDWPVFLGQVVKDPANQKQPFTIDLAGRPYVGLVGERVDAPSGRARLQVGAELATDDLRFAVFIPEVQEQDKLPANPKSPPRPQLSINKKGNLDLRHDATLSGNLTMAGGAIEFEAGTARDPSAPPWAIYLLEPRTGEEELRIEMRGPAPGGQAGNNQVVIGSWFKGPDETGNETEAFHPCLSVSDDCTVTVYGNLVVVGQIIETQARVAARASAATRLFLESMISSGIVTGGQSALAGAAAANSKFAMRAASADDAIKDFAHSIAADQTLIDRFAEHVKTSDTTLADKLITALSTKA